MACIVVRDSAQSWCYYGVSILRNPAGVTRASPPGIIVVPTSQRGFMGSLLFVGISHFRQDQKVLDYFYD